MENFEVTLPAVPGVPWKLHYTLVIDGGYHGLYGRLPRQTQLLVDAWVNCAAQQIFPALGWPLFSERNLRGTTVQAAIVANGHEPVDAVAMVNALLRGHEACVARRAQVFSQIIAEAAGLGRRVPESQVSLIADRVCEDWEEIRGQIDPSTCDFDSQVLQPIVRRHVDGYLSGLIV